ncbi:MAG: hypothetical protein OXQ30_08470 [Boseongicola sp.]|nr:hypothetical protein [Boseongicola sp.]
MANQDSFIDEVTEEVRRDRLYKTFRKYGWIAVVLVVLLVGGATFLEIRKSQANAAAQAAGDAVLAALEIEDASARQEALAALQNGENAERDAIVGLAAADAALQAGDRASALSTYEAIAGNSSLSASFRDLATLKLVLASGSDIAPADRISQLNAITLGAGPFRLLALEQVALAEVEQGNPDAALTHLREIIADATVTQDLRRRASQLIVALGGDLTGG